MTIASPGSTGSAGSAEAPRSLGHDVPPAVPNGAASAEGAAQRDPAAAPAPGRAGDGPRPRTWWQHGLTLVAPPALVAAAVVGVWSLITDAVLEPRRRFLLPPPQDVVSDGFLAAATPP